MKRPVRDAETGTYSIKGSGIFKELFGSREQVWNGSAYKTKYGLTKGGLVMNKWGRIVSKDKFESASNEMRLEKHGYGAKKGKFGYIKTQKAKKGRKSRTRKNMEQ
jgi:hypothetical protein